MFLQALRKPAMVVASVLALSYLTYRIGFTLNLITPYAVFASVLLLIGEIYGIFMMMLYFVQLWELRESPCQPVLPNRTVDVFVATYNEDLQLLRATLQACLRMDYPHRTYVLDDGRRPDVKVLAEELGVLYITRSDNRHAKAGNLNNALKQTDGAFVIFFDADHVPEKYFITRLIGYFADEKLGFVQTPHAFYNFDSFQASHDANKKTYWEEGDVFYNVIQLGKNQYNCPIFAGSAAMFRRKALEEIGYMAVETLTEDMHTGLRVNARGWKSLAISERLIAGQAAPDVTTFHSQRLRWAKGNLSILAVDNPLTISGLTLGQRLCHLASCLYWLGGLFRLPVYLTPLLFLFTGVSPVGEFTGMLVIMTSLYLLITWSVVTLASKDRFSFWNSELFDMMSFWTKTRAVGALLWGSRGKFVVTSKRGRQSKSIWPLLRPHLVLVVVTLLALCWGWGRFLLGVSDDWGKLVLSTLWASFYMSLAFVVIRRALTPDDARYDYRHVVNLGLTYQVEGREPKPAEPRLAMTVDVSEGGLCILSYERLEPGTVLNIELHGAGEILHCHGRVAWSNKLLRSEGMPFQGFRNGVALEDLTPAQLDVLQRLCMHYAVSRQYYDIAAHAARAGAGNSQTLSLDGGLKGPSFEFHLPLMLEVPGEVNKTTYCCTEAVAQSGLNVLLPTPLAPGTKYTFSMSTPLGNLRGEVEAVRHDKLPLGGETYYLCTFSFLDVAELGRAILDALIGPAEPGEELLTILKPRRQKRRLPVKSPLRIIALLVLPLLAAQTGAFYWYHADDLRLRDVITASVVNNGDTEDVRRISEQTDQQSHPSIDRLALLRRAWMRVGDEKQVDRLTDVLATRYPSNSELQIALLDVHVKNRDLERATAVYQHITNLLAYYFMPETRKKDLLMVIGRACVHGGDYPAAADYFTRALQMAPADRVLRKEYAGVLLQNDRPQEVLALYGDDEKSKADRLLLAAAYQRLNHLAEAEHECRLALQEAPEDIPGHLQLAETLRAADRKQEAADLYAHVARVDPTNERLRMGLAFEAVGDGDYTKALRLFRSLVAKDSKRADLVRGFVDAAAGVDKLTAADRALVLRFFEHLNDADKQNRVFVDRLSWVLQKLGEYERSEALLRLLIPEGSANRDLRLRLAVCLDSLKRDAEAVEVLAPLGKDPEAICLRAGMCLHKGDAATAEKLCRELLADAPNDSRTLNLFAITLATAKKYQAAEEVWQRLARMRPNDLAPRARLADVSLWKKDYPTAVARYERLLDGAIQQPALWAGFADAASGCEGRLTEEQKQLALQLAEVFQDSDSVSVTAMTRLGYALMRSKASPKVARSLLELALEKAPEDAAVCKELAGVLAVADMPRQAVDLYEKFTLTFEEQCQLAYVYVAAGEPDKAEQLARDLCRCRPDNRELQHRLGNVLAWSRRYDEAAKVFQEMLDATPDDSGAQAALAHVYLWARYYDEAEEALQRLARMRPDDRTPRVRLADVSLWKKDYPTAVARYERLLAGAIQQPALWAGFADAASGCEGRLTEEQKQLALQLAETFRNSDSVGVAALTRLSYALVRAKASPKLVRSLLELAIQKAPEDDEAACKELAGVLAVADMPKQALELYKKLNLSLEEQCQVAYIHVAAGEPDKAEQLARELCRRRPDDRELQHCLANVLAWTKRYSEAAKIYQEMLRATPDDRRAQLGIAQVQLWSRHYDKALALYRRMLKAHPEVKDYYAGYIDAAASATGIDAGADGPVVSRLVDWARQDGSEEAVILKRLGWVCQRMRNRTAAVELLNRARKFDPEDNQLVLQLADLLYEMGNYREAETHYLLAAYR